MTARTTVQIDLTLAGNLSQAAVERGVRAATSEAEARLKGDVLGRPGTGIVYEKYNPRRTHRASIPGAAPAPDTGAAGLRGSVSKEVFAMPDGALGLVSVNKEYAAALQFGTDRVKPRPFLDILIREYGARIQAAFNQYARLP